ncbi:MAG: hypothetical protein H5T86_14910, partial [Armatimonadetes bacterium]|nr:hypothetical protein [Armatimonadota bacterium]
AGAVLVGTGTNIDVAYLSPTWALAALQAGRYIDHANAALLRIAASVSDAGLLPYVLGGEPCVEATELAAPLLSASLLWHADKLRPEVREALRAALVKVAGKLASARPEDEDLRLLVLAAARAMIGKVLEDAKLLGQAHRDVGKWLEVFRKNGLLAGHGPLSEATRLCALEWLQEALGPTANELELARAAVWADLLQRLAGPLRVLIGPQYFSSADDVTGKGALEELLALAEGARAPVNLKYAYYAMPFRNGATVVAPPQQPFTAVYSWSAEPLIEEFISAHESFALGIQTAPLNGTSVPVHIAWLGGELAASYVTVSGPCHCAAVPGLAQALVNLDFDGVGRGERTEAWADFHIARRSTLRRVLVGGREWPGVPVAVDVGVSVAVSTDDGLLGIIPCWAGPAGAGKATARIKPGVLEWRGEGPNAELVLRLYARQASYALPRPENDYVVGFFLAAASLGETSPEEFVQSLRTFSCRQTAQERQWRVPQKDEGHPILDRWKPKPKRAYAVDRALEYTLDCRFQGKSWKLVEDLYRERVEERVASDQPVAPGRLLFDTPWLKLEPG